MQLLSELSVLIRRGVRRGVVDLDDILDTFILLFKLPHPKSDNALQNLPIAAIFEAWVAFPLEEHPNIQIVAAHTNEQQDEDATVVDNYHAQTFTITPSFSTLVETFVQLLFLKYARATVEHVQQTKNLAPSDVLTLFSDQTFAPAHVEQLCAWLLGPAALRRVFVENAFFERADSPTEGAVAQLLAHIAEQGLLQRPLHLFFGPPIFTWCLSPYVRDLREPIIQWARDFQTSVASDLHDLPDVIHEDLLYALAHDFNAIDPRLRDERHRADRTVGIFRFPLGVQLVDVIDCGRIDKKAIDVRIPWQKFHAAPPVFIRLSITGGASELITQLLSLTSDHIRGLTLVYDGHTSDEDLHGVLPPYAIDSAGRILDIPGTSSLRLEELQAHSPFASSPLHFGLTPTVATRLRERHPELNLRMSTSVDETLLETVRIAHFAQRLPCPLNIAAIANRSVHTSRPHWQALQCHSTMALSVLKSLFPRVPTAQATSGETRQRPTSRRAGLKV